MKSDINIYFKARQEAAKTDKRLSSRESAAELLGCSASSLANYELGVTKAVPPDAVVMMADLYNAPELKSRYCANECPIGKGAPIPTTVGSIELVTCRLIRALSQGTIDSIKRQFVEIAADGKVTDEELPQIESLNEHLGEMSQTISELQMLCQKVLSAGGLKPNGADET
jgi:transcriptional regulator with XRE-family HTH domain